MYQYLLLQTSEKYPVSKNYNLQLEFYGVLGKIGYT